MMRAAAVAGTMATVPVAIATIAVAIAVVLALPACGRESAAHPGGRISASDPGAVARDADAIRLPEDPVAGHQSELQWRAHMDAEERERQLGYDKRRLKEHRSVIKLLATARARFDRARTAAAVAHARAGMPASLDDVRRRITSIDHWGVNSPLLKDYEALIEALTGAYPEARLAALRGDAGALTQQRAAMDRRIRQMKRWLDDAANYEEE